MTWIENLFKRKVGGTFIGNALRTTVGLLTNGALGTGEGMITQKQSDIRDMTDTDFIKKYGETKTGVKVPGVTPDPSIKSASEYWTASGNVDYPAKFNLLAMVMGYLPWILGFFAALYALPKIIKALK